MAFCVFVLAKRGRHALSSIFVGLSTIAFIISSLMFIYCLFIVTTIANYLPTENAVISLIFMVILMDELQLMMFFLIGMKVSRDCYNNAHTKKSRYILRIWHYIGYLSLFNVLVIGTMGASVSNHIVRSLHISMERGIKRYLQKLNWKRAIDYLQYKIGCCGSRSYEDWYRIPWMRSYQFNLKDAVVQKNSKALGEDIYVSAVPWSCCRINVQNACLHDPIQQIQSQQEWDKANSTIYTEGCVEILRKPIEDGFVFFMISSIILFCLQLILTAITKLIYTSNRNAVILGTPDGRAPGWIFGRKDLNDKNKGFLLKLLGRGKKGSVRSKRSTDTTSYASSRKSLTTVRSTEEPGERSEEPGERSLESMNYRSSSRSLMNVSLSQDMAVAMGSAIQKIRDARNLDERSESEDESGGEESGPLLDNK